MTLSTQSTQIFLNALIARKPWALDYLEKRPDMAKYIPEVGDVVAEIFAAQNYINDFKIAHRTTPIALVLFVTNWQMAKTVFAGGGVFGDFYVGLLAGATQPIVKFLMIRALGQPTL